MEHMERRPGTPEESKVIVRTLACVLEKLVDVTQKLDIHPPQTITKFHASRPPSISITDYLERINKYAACSTECLVLALIYIDRLIQQSSFALSALNVHRVIITSVMLAAKFFDDKYFNNLYYAKVGGVPNKEINSLEVEFLFLINFSLHVDEDMYFRYYNELVNHAINSTCACCTGTRVSRPVSPVMPRAAEVMVQQSMQAAVVPTMVCPPTPPTTQPTTQAPMAMSHAVPADIERFTSYYSTPAYESSVTEQPHSRVVPSAARVPRVPPYMAAPIGTVVTYPASWDRAPGGALLHHYGPKSCMLMESKSLPHPPVMATRNMPFAPIQDENTRSACLAFYAQHFGNHVQVLHT